jgi:hypothetical protein
MPSAITASTSQITRPRSISPNGTARYHGVCVIGDSSIAPTSGENQARDSTASQNADRAATG